MFPWLLTFSVGLGWAGAVVCVLPCRAATAGPLVPDVQLEQFGCGRSSSQQEQPVDGMGADGEGTTSPIKGLECFKIAWIERPASGLFDRCYLEGRKKEGGEQHVPYLPDVRGDLAAGSSARNGCDAISDGSHIPPHWRMRDKKDDKWTSLVTLEAFQMEWNRTTA